MAPRDPTAAARAALKAVEAVSAVRQMDVNENTVAFVAIRDSQPRPEVVAVLMVPKDSRRRGLTSQDLRDVSLPAAATGWLEETYGVPHSEAIKRLRRRRVTDRDARRALVAFAYLKAQSEGTRPWGAVRKELERVEGTSFTDNQLRERIRDATKAGFLAPGQPGSHQRVPGPELDRFVRIYVAGPAEAKASALPPDVITTNRGRKR